MYGTHYNSYGFGGQNVEIDEGGVESSRAETICEAHNRERGKWAN